MRARPQESHQHFCPRQGFPACRQRFSVRFERAQASFPLKQGVAANGDILHFLFARAAVLATGLRHVLPPAPLRQWVLSLPYGLRALLAYEPGLMSVVAKVFADSLLRWYGRRLARDDSDVFVHGAPSVVGGAWLSAPMSMSARWRNRVDAQPSSKRQQALAARSSAGWRRLPLFQAGTCAWTLCVPTRKMTRIDANLTVELRADSQGCP